MTLNHKAVLARAKLTIIICLGACSSTNLNIPGDAYLVPQHLVVRNSQPRSQGGIPVELDTSVEGFSNNMKMYFISEDKESVMTRYVGNGGPGSMSFSHFREEAGEWSLLLCRVSGSDYYVTIAKWKSNKLGEVMDPHVRLKPVAEWRWAGKIKDSTVANTREWRAVFADQSVDLTWSIQQPF